MRILGEDSYWWKNEEKEWAAQDKSGKWWVYKKNEEPIMQIKAKPKSQHSLSFSAKEYIIIALGAALGISLALNVVALIS